ncbi:hypothetical protein [Rhizobium etli]|uniref:hypothetical protein n=1 Tax=Rhizobium etli TaxID=29449 RepID=UPI0012BB81F1|nr:hypothetical protein [Rhizobium etli]
MTHDFPFRSEDWRTVFSPGRGKGAIGILLDDHGHLWVAGGQAGDFRVVDPVTGQLLKDYKLAKDGEKSGQRFHRLQRRSLCHRLLLSRDVQNTSGESDVLPEQSDVSTIPLTGYKYVGEGDLGRNSNGIVSTRTVAPF